MGERMAKNVERQNGLDIIRCIAILFVIILHFNAYNHKGETTGIPEIIMIYFWWLAFSCIGLFLLLTGYLMNQKKWDLLYLKKIIRIIVLYIVISIICYVFRTNYNNQSINIYQLAVDLISFHGAKYSWYVNMYIGLFLLIPYINVMFNNLDKKNKQILILIMIILSGIPIYGRISFWNAIYPLSYYLLGAFFSQYPVKGKKLIIFLTINVIIFLEVIVKSYSPEGFLSLDISSYGYVGTVVVGVGIFIVFYQSNVKNKYLKKIIESVSKVSFSMYLISEVYDTVVYRLLDSYTSDYSIKAKLFIPCIAVIFILSYISAWIIERAYDFLASKLQEARLRA